MSNNNMQWSVSGNVAWSQAEINALLSMAKECKRYGGPNTYRTIAEELSRQVGTNPQMPHRRGRPEGEDEFSEAMVLNQFERLERRNPELLPKRVETTNMLRGMRQREARNAKNRELDEAEGFDAETAEGPQTKEEVHWQHEELQLLSQLALNRHPRDARSIANSMNANVASKTLRKVRECPYTEQMITDAYQYMMDRGWKPPTLEEQEAFEKGSSRSAGHRPLRISELVDEPSMAGSSGSHVQKQKIPTFEPPSQEAIMAFSGPLSSYSQRANLPGNGPVIGSHGHQVPQQHSLPGIGSIIGSHGHQAPSQHAGLPGIGSVVGSHGQVQPQHSLPRIGSVVGSHGHRVPPQHSLPGIGSVVGSHSHQGTPQHVNAPEMMGTSSSQHLHVGAQPVSRDLPLPINNQRTFHSLTDHDHHAARTTRTEFAADYGTNGSLHSRLWNLEDP